MERDTVGEVTGIDGYLFRLVATFEAAAMQQLGKIAHPITGDVEVDLPGASDSIEMLAAIQRKTDGNLNNDEKRLLDHVLYQLRMNYVDVAREHKTSEPDEGPSDEPAAGATEEAADEPAAGATEEAADEPAAGATEERAE
jgi:hypothetical protein